jgi:hypothetical protein
MEQAKKRRFAVAVLGASLIVFMGASFGMSLDVEPFYTWYYLFAWWPFIIMLESALFLGGGYSLLWEKPREFLLLLPLSVTIWLVFEAYNFRLENWHYVSLPRSAPLRWAGYLLSYASVLPGIFVVMRLFEFTGLWEDGSVRPLRRPGRLVWPLLFLGAACALLPLLQPRYFFPLVWGAFIFLLEPWLYSEKGRRSLLRMWERGSLRQFQLLLLAGLVCGLLWELWNFWAGAKWVYSVPFVGFFKVFEMPVLGFLGFPPFAVECYVMAGAFELFRQKVGNLPGARGRLVWALVIPAVAAFDVWVMYGIDRFTVLSFR